MTDVEEGHHLPGCFSRPIPCAAVTERWPSDSRASPVSGLLIIVSCLTIALLAGAVSCRRTSPLGEPRVIPVDFHQVILITIDALRADALLSGSDALLPGPDGKSWTPAIDVLASHSLVFSQARTPAPWTLASFSSVMTGFPVSVHQAKKF